MKKSLKELKLNKEVISKLDLDKIEGGLFGTLICQTDGPLNSCAPPGGYCY